MTSLSPAQEINMRDQEIARERMEAANQKRVDAMHANDPDAWDRADAQWRVRAAEWQALVREAAEWNNK
jgi:hypothetical protein